MYWIALQPLPEPALAEGANPLCEGDHTPGEGGSPALVDVLSALGWWALQFTPKVARLEDALLLEVSASERLWGGRQALIRHIFESNKPPATVQYAQGATSLIAFSRLQTDPLGATSPDDLPLATLVAARPHLPTLVRMGCSHWGQLRALPRGGVARRFGAPLLEALDRAYGHRPDLYPWLVVPEVFEATLELGAQVETAPALLFGARRLLGSLQVWLQLRHSGVLALELGWTMDARRDTATQGQLVVRTAEPTGDMSHLQRLLGEHLARVTLPAPVSYLRLRTLETQKLRGESTSLLSDEQRRGDSLHQLLERLSARLGPQQVLQMQACADHRPELMQRWQPASSASHLIAACAGGTGARGQNYPKNPENLMASALYPTWLLAVPLPLAVQHNRPQYQGPLSLLAGPQRLEAGWWGGGDGALRDYFLAHSERMGLLWIYRERLMGPGRAGVQAGGQAEGETERDPARWTEAESQWYLHGLFA
ncbi:Y-family DNA polymerase [Rhodoferax ferrireducens]|uniref:Y-family DNA polymerase n=1 Tax=Rhodoferax ferrireducens TaxID=192843 RepID=UPI000E0DCC42|nr:DNA polymerase Y family protein [Rhodoferax ferrireducens]